MGIVPCTCHHCTSFPHAFSSSTHMHYQQGGSGSVRERRKLFSRKSHSVENSTTGRSIGVVGVKVTFWYCLLYSHFQPFLIHLKIIELKYGIKERALQVLAPGVDSANATEIRNSMDSLDDGASQASKDTVKRASRTSLVSDIVDRIRGRSKSREPAAVQESKEAKYSAQTSTRQPSSSPKVPPKEAKQERGASEMKAEDKSSKSTPTTTTASGTTDRRTSSYTVATRYTPSSYTSRAYSATSYRTSSRTSSTDSTSYAVSCCFTADIRIFFLTVAGFTVLL